jgi:hypothetical protein
VSGPVVAWRLPGVRERERRGSAPQVHSDRSRASGARRHGVLFVWVPTRQMVQ